jgi:quercetin dioxygenase-like cupin family protein
MTTTNLPPDTAPALYVVRDRIRFFGPVEGSDLKLLEVEIPPGSGSPPHRHASPETFRILEGEITFGLFEPGRPPEQVVAGSGAVLRLKSWQGHNYTNMGRTTARMLVIVDDSMIDFFEDLGTEATPEAGPPSDAEIGAIMAACQRHGIEVLAGPVPA